MLQEDPLLLGGRLAVPFAHGADRCEDEFRERTGLHDEVRVRSFRTEYGKRRSDLVPGDAGRNLGGGLLQFLRPGVCREGEESAVLRRIRQRARRGEMKLGLDRAKLMLRPVPELGPRIVAHHDTRNLRIAAMPPKARRRSWPSSESFEMSSTFVPICPARPVRSSMSSRFSTTVRGPPSIGHVGSSPASSTVFSPSQSPFAHRSLRRTFRSPSEMSRVSTAPRRSAFRTWSSPYAARPPSAFRISSMRRWTRDFSRIRSSPLRMSRDFSTSSRRPYSSVYPVSRYVGSTFFFNS